MLTTFFDSQGPLVQGFNLSWHQNEAYCQTLQHLLTKIRDGCQGKISDGIIWLHNYFHSTWPTEFRTNRTPCSARYSNIPHTAQTYRHVNVTSKEAIDNCMIASKDSVQETVVRCFRWLPTELFAARTAAPAGLLYECRCLFLLNTAIYSWASSNGV